MHKVYKCKNFSKKMAKIKIPDLNKIIKPTWKHKPGYGIRGKKGLHEQEVWAQATTPEDPEILKKLGIKKGQKILVIAGFYGNWAAAIKKAGANVTYSDISLSIVNYVKKNSKIKFDKHICSNYELIPGAPKKYDWTFTFEACGGSQGLPIAYLRSLMNNCGGILVLHYEKGRHMGSKYKRYPKIIKTLSRIYGAKGSMKKTKFMGYGKGRENKSRLTHFIYTIKTNEAARKKAEADIKLLDYLRNKRKMNLENDSGIFNITKGELRDSVSRLSKVSELSKKEFRREIELR